MLSCFFTLVSLHANFGEVVCLYQCDGPLHEPVKRSVNIATVALSKGTANADRGLSPAAESLSRDHADDSY